MKNEKNIFSSVLYKGMDEDISEHSLPNAKKSQAEFDKFVRKVYEAEEIIYKTTREDRIAFNTLSEKVNSFLQRHAGLDYEEFVIRANPYGFDNEDYSVLPKNALKRRLFDHRAYLYLSALEDCEKEGADIEDLLEQISNGRIPFIKKEKDEPTFNSIRDVLKRSH